MEDLAESLANEILSRRKDELFKSSFKKTSNKVYDKYFSSIPKRRKSPYLKEGIHGVTVDGIHYVPASTDWRGVTRKYGKSIKYYPNKSEMEKAVDEYRSIASSMSMEAETSERKEVDQSFTVTLSYPDKSQQYADYKGKADDKYYVGTNDEGYKGGPSAKMSGLDRIIAKSIDNWAKRNGIVATVESKWIDDEEDVE